MYYANRDVFLTKKHLVIITTLFTGLLVFMMLVTHDKGKLLSEEKINLRVISKSEKWLSTYMDFEDECIQSTFSTPVDYAVHLVYNEGDLIKATRRLYKKYGKSYYNYTIIDPCIKGGSLSDGLTVKSSKKEEVKVVIIGKHVEGKAGILYYKYNNSEIVREYVQGGVYESAKVGQTILANRITYTLKDGKIVHGFEVVLKESNEKG